MRRMIRRWMGAVMLASSVVLIGGCASGAKQVKCEGHLEPINKSASGKLAAAPQLPGSRVISPATQPANGKGAP
jgi:hypothetical protein